jgi:SPP1 family predicted phage head-tail adaptor
VRSGRLRTRVYLEQSRPATNAVGEPVEAWEVVAETWAGRAGLGGSERFVGDQHTSEIRTAWEFRYRRLFDPRWRIREKHNGQVHEIEAVQDPDGRRRTLMVTTTTAQPQGSAEWVA